MKTYVLLADDKIKRCLRVFEPTKESPCYHLQISQKPEMYATGPQWGRLASKELKIEMFFFPLTSERIIAANAIFAKLVTKHGTKTKKASGS
jgi:hypothetical protein